MTPSSKQPTNEPAAPAAPPDFETALARMEAIVYELEEGRIGLAEALARYEEGVGLLRQCFALLETAERKIELLTGVDAAGNPITEAYDATASAERAEQGAPRSRQRSAGAKTPKTPRGAAELPTAEQSATEPPQPPDPPASPTKSPQNSHDPDSPSDSSKIDAPGRLF